MLISTWKSLAFSRKDSLNRHIGPQHRLRRAADRRRDERLRRAGYRVLRIEVEFVRRDLAEAVRRIREALDEAPP